MAIDDLIRAALEWADAGVPVFPCKSDKSPLTENGHKDATTDPKKIRTLFQAHERAAEYIGAAMGRAAGMFAVDVDLYKSPEAEAWLKARQSDGTLPPTRCHRTKSGGIHLFYSSESAWPNCKPYDGIDVKGEGGYVIVPPSPGYTVETKGLVEAPSGLLRLLEEARQARTLASDTALEEAILTGADFHESIVQLSARRAQEGKTLLEIKRYINDLMEQSDARHPTNHRHARWASFQRSDELMRAVSSAIKKYNNDEPSRAMQQSMDADRLSAAADALGFFRAPTVGEQEESFYAVGFPYSTADGYFAHQDIDLQAERPVIEGICYENEVTIVSADPKAGKTVFGIDCGLSVAYGRDLGRDSLRVGNSGPALYFGLEGRSAIRKRIAAWKLHHGVSEEVPFFAVERAANFYDAKRRDVELNKIIQADRYWSEKGLGKIKLIVIDTLTKAMIGGNQNDADDTAKLFEFVSILRDQGVTACIMLVHHKRKAQKGDPGDGPRGSGNILAECDVSLHLRKDEHTVSIHVADARSIEDGATYYRKMVSVPLFKDAWGNDVTSVCMEEGEAPTDDYSEESVALKDKLAHKVYNGVIALGEGAHSAAVVLEEVLRPLVLREKQYAKATWKSKPVQAVLQTHFDCDIEHRGYLLSPEFGSYDRVTSVDVSPITGDAEPDQAS